MNLTKAETDALKWLRDRGGSGVFETNKMVLVAAGERACFMRSTWNHLRDKGHVTIEKHRVTVT